MGVSTTESKIKYEGNGVASVFSVPFPFQSREEIIVKVRDDQTLEVYDLVVFTDYILRGVNRASGGSVTLENLVKPYLVAGNLAVNFTLLIKRVPILNQETDFKNAGPFFPEIHEDRFDRQTFFDQKLSENIDRGVYFDEFSDVGPGTLPEPENGMYLAWDGVDGKIKNSAVTIDPLLLDAEDIVYDNTISGLTAANVKAAIDENKSLIDAANADISDVADRVTDTEVDIAALDGRVTTNESDISAIQTLINGFFPVGKIDMTLTNDAPNNLNWLRISGLGAQTLAKAGTYANLFNYLDGKGFFSDPFSHDLFADAGSDFTIQDFAALSPRSIGTNTINSHTKIGPSEGSVQEDQMQRITGSLSDTSIRSASGVGTGALSDTTYANFAATGGSSRGVSALNFDSGDSTGARVSSNADANGETRSNTFGVYYWIRY